LIEGADLAAVCAELAGSTASEVGEEEWAAAVSTAAERQRGREQPISDGPAIGGHQPAEGVESKGASGNQGGAASPAPGHALSAGPSYVRRVVEVIRQVATAAHTLHEAGVVHRDIKPGNIILGHGDRHAVLMDLGLAQLADETEGRLTRTRQFVGTLRYASPEQVLAARRLDARSDVYGLGATLWELRTLRPLFGADEQTPTPELMERILHEEPGRVRKHNPGVSRDLEAIALKCLEKNPARRYATAQELADDLGR